MNNWKVILATLVIFGAGVVTGGLLVNHVKGGRVRAPRHVVQPALPPPANPVVEPRIGFNREPLGGGPAQQRLGEGLLLRMDREMRLTPEQRERIRLIITEGQERLREANEKFRPILQKEMQETRRRIREVLTSEQRERFEELMKQRPQRRPEDSSNPERRPRDAARPLPPLDGPPLQDAPPPAVENP